MEQTIDTELEREFIALEARNRVHHRQQVLDLLRAGIIAHSSYEADIEVVERLGELVVIMGAERIVNAPGAPLIHRRFTNMWRQEAGEWRMFMRHANITAPQP
jgi:uncharacterized protein DUF4440